MKKRQPTVKTQTSAILVHAYNTGHHSFSEEVNLTDHDPNYRTYKIKEEIRIRLPQQNKQGQWNRNFKIGSRNTLTEEPCDSGSLRECIFTNSP